MPTSMQSGKCCVRTPSQVDERLLHSLRLCTLLKSTEAAGRYLADHCTARAAARPPGMAPPGWSTPGRRWPGHAGSPAAGNPSVLKRAPRAAGSGRGPPPSWPSRRPRRGAAICGRPCGSSTRLAAGQSSPARSSSCLRAVALSSLGSAARSFRTY